VSPVILLGLVVMWAVVLVPMWLRRHDEVEETRSVDRFNTAMHTLSRREAAVDKKYVVMPHRSRSLEVHVSGASADGQRPARRRPTAPRPAERHMTTAATRRRRTLIGLVVATLLTLGAAVVIGGLALWGLQAVADAGLIGFIAHLRNRARAATVARPVRHRRPGAPARPRPMEEPEYDDEYDEFEPVAVTIRAAVVEPEPLFDQTQTAELDQPAFDDTAYAEVAHGKSVYDDRAFTAEAVAEDLIPVPAARSHIEFEPVAASDEFFDQAVEVRRPAAPERVEVRKPAARDLEIDIPLADPVVEPAAATGNEIGARPWEPVPVPRPVYASKPVAPPRSNRAPIFEPLLPPIETVAELDPVDDLEEILDRRWAVND
jgi:hypothetical protein